MKNALLDALLSDEFYESAGTISSPSGLRRFLQKSKHVDTVRRAIEVGAITDSTVRRFVENLSNAFEKGKQFPCELTIAALAVALEERKTDFVEEFLYDLARLNIIEMRMAPVIAQESLRRWLKLPRVKEKSFRATSASDTRPARTWQSKTICVRVRNRVRALRFEAENAGA